MGNNLPKSEYDGFTKEEISRLSKRFKKLDKDRYITTFLWNFYDDVEVRWISRYFDLIDTFYGQSWSIKRLYF